MGGPGSEPVTDLAAPQASDRIALGGSDVTIPPLGVGTWAWGDKGTWGMGGYDQSLTEASIRDAWQASIEAGVVLFDSAEVYGNGESERIIGRLLANDPGARDRVVIATKFMPSPWKLNVHAALLAAARHSLERLGIESIDLYQIHGPISLRSHDVMAEALAAAHAEGLVRAVGVSNYSAKETRAIDGALPPTRPASGQQPGGVLAVAHHADACAGCWIAAGSSVWCLWRTRRSGRDV